MIQIDMEMPDNCGECQFCHTESFTQWCCPTGREDVSYALVPQWCPLREMIRCGKCRHYQGNHDVPGCAPCGFWGIGAVMWDDYCKRGKRYDSD